jgi:hypothetical protein
MRLLGLVLVAVVAGGEPSRDEQWKSEVSRLAERAATGSKGFMFPWVAKDRATKAYTQGVKGGIAQVLEGDTPREVPSPPAGEMAIPGSVGTDAASVGAHLEGGFFVSRPHMGLKVKRKMCMTCRIVFSSDKAAAASAASGGKQLAAAKSKGAAIQAEAAAGRMGRIAAGDATGDPFYGTNPRDDARRDKDEQLRQCLTLPEGEDQEQCKTRVNGRKVLIENPHKAFGGGFVTLPEQSSASDPNGLLGDPSKEYDPASQDTTQPAPDTTLVKESLMQMHARGGIDDETFRALLEQEPEPLGEEEVPASSGPVPPADEVAAAIAQAGPKLRTKRMPHLGPMGGLDAGGRTTGNGVAIPVYETEVCLNEGSRAFVYALWKGMFASDFDGADVSCDDADP